MVKVVAIKFKNGGKLYYFAPKEGETYTRDMPVIVETSKGLEFAWVAYPEKQVTENEITPPLKSVVRIATEKDKLFYKSCLEKKPDAMAVCKQKILELNLDMKLVDCEYAFDGSKIVFYFTSAGRVDFRELVRNLAAHFHSRIELRQVGTRDETKYLGGLAPCGRVCCCAGNMPEFKKVTIKMAKTQGLSLNPGKISGLCGRLMCCLSYESEYYAEAFKKVPKIGSAATSPDGSGTVVSVNMLKMEVKLRLSDNAGNIAYRDYPVSALQFKKQQEQATSAAEEEDFLPDSEESDETKPAEEKNNPQRQSAGKQKEGQRREKNAKDKQAEAPRERRDPHGERPANTAQKAVRRAVETPRSEKQSEKRQEENQKPVRQENVFDSSSVFDFSSLPEKEK
ncbi:MAG: regulatory iron-sulfur-containing complex subunit RicT [Candidatus Borkfalkiaceae bacterium]|nr:regulatory iron-sulfur-containing complex subunit RicT [Clostridia bacterium]MDY6222653.1 regulatory iron-sulfur-containing complex subunit RicT [Christensenellaceae bacterium]